MKAFIRNNWFKLSILCYLVLVFIFFGTRPAYVRQACRQELVEKFKGKESVDPTEARFIHWSCMNKYGVSSN